MIKYFTALRPFIGSMLLFIFFSCGPKPLVTPSVDEAKLAAEKANKELITETGESTEVEKNLSGVSAEVTSALYQPSEELTRTDVLTYTTGEPGWIRLQKKKRFSDDMTRPQAKENLLRELRNDAVNKKVGTTVELTTLLTDVMSTTGNESFEQSAWSGFFRSTVSGVITDERQEKNKIKHFNEGEGFELDLEYSFYVQPVTGKRDPGFWLDAELGDNMLNSGDKLRIKIRPSKTSYLYIFNLMADNNAVLMFPNEYMDDNYVVAGKDLILPDPKIENYISFVVGGIEGQKITSESIYIICSKQKIRLPNEIPRIGESLQTFSKESENFISLQKWLTKIPLDQRIEKVLMYYISD